MLGTMILSSVVLVALSVQAPPPAAVATSPTYRIGVGDVLAIQVWEEDDLTGQYTVEGDGAVAFPLVGRVPAADLAVHDFEASLQTRLADGFLRRPLVRVQVAEYRSRRVFVMGEVARPGPIPGRAAACAFGGTASAAPDRRAGPRRHRAPSCGT